MNLVLEKLSRKTTPVDVIVTADARGNYIEHMIKKCGGSALRVPDGYRAFAALKRSCRTLTRVPHSIAVALDGPLGPRHEPKKLAFYLSEHAEEEFVGIKPVVFILHRLTRRWDKYVIPLPFTRSVGGSEKLWGSVKKCNTGIAGGCSICARGQTPFKRGLTPMGRIITQKEILYILWKQITF